MGWGESRVTLYINVFSVAVNLCLDPILIFGGPAEVETTTCSGDL
jgi:Na+-driven multidrug efflux pump